MTVLATFNEEGRGLGQGRTYAVEVREGKDGVIYCTCLSWRYSKPPKDCKHLRQIRDAFITGDREVFAQLDVPSEHTRNLGR